ncbi:AraC family transcriptional regulator [uncultured Desulfobacter sp.]|uniref:helix-turn-helix transcriptional regulator n=1 Tax=uncultured Desulfobacter sp. TaxID=240139 RepID=UPI0029F5129C|nr:AraC family transcriptional regulator [uncultured Desulfobacter sp.]
MMQKIQLSAPQPTETPNRFRRDLPSALGQMKYDIHLFNSGLKLFIIHTRLNQPVQIQAMASNPLVGFGFCVDGSFDTFFSSKLPITTKAGDSGFFSCPSHIEITDHIPSDRLLRIYLMLEGEILSSFTKGDEDYFSFALKSLDKKQPSRIVHPITPLMQAALHQILHCPYCGKAGHLYLESKAMELLSHKLAQLHPSDGCRNFKLKRADYERIIHVAEILVNNMENPPDTIELARIVGLSCSKLQRCFRRVYGVSPFEYLRNHRLQTARQLLQKGEINVTEASLRVGYTNLSYFSKAFKIMFGIPPGQLLHNPPHR